MAFGIKSFDVQLLTEFANGLQSQVGQPVGLYDQEGDLQTATPTAHDAPRMSLTLSDRLTNWLLDLRVLRHVPLPYLVPDPALLPPESIRFFRVDPTWADRLVDGAISARNLGTVDMTVTLSAMGGLRRYLDQLLGLDEAGTMSGMLIRSEIVARWPDLLVRAYRPAPPAPNQSPVSPVGNVPIVRKDRLSKNIMIVLFAGVPEEIRLREPHVATRFGVEGDLKSPTVPTLPSSEAGELPTGKEWVPSNAPEFAVPYREATTRVLDLSALSGQISLGVGQMIGGRLLALHLLRNAYVQRFVDPDVYAQQRKVDPKDDPELTPGSQPSATSAGPLEAQLMNGRKITIRLPTGARGL